MRWMDLGELPPNISPHYVSEFRDIEGGGVEISCEIGDVGMALTSYCLYPNEEVLRAGFQAKIGSHALANLLVRHHNTEVSEWLSADYEEAWPDFFAQMEWKNFGRFGGHISLSRLPDGFEGDVQRRTVDFFWAGRMLTMLAMMRANHQAQLRGGASLNKVKSLLSKIGGPSVSKLSAVWSDFKEVSHVSAAIDYWRLLHNLEYDFEEPGNLFEAAQHIPAPTLYVAKFYERLLLGLEPKHGEKSSPVSGEDIWRIPEEICYIPDLIHLPPMSADMLKRLKEYRAPVSAS